MRRLFTIALRSPQHRKLLFITIMAMCFLTFASQLEILTLGIITKKGPDFFELFAPIKEGKLSKDYRVSLDRLESRFQEIDHAQNGYITPLQAEKFLEKVKRPDFIASVLEKIQYYVPISDNIRNLAILIIFVAIFRAGTLFVHRFSTRLLSIHISRDLRQAYFEHIQSLPMTFYQKYDIGSLSSRAVGDAALVAEAVNACLVNYLQTPFVVLTTLTLCFLTSWQLSLIIFFGFPLIVFPIVFLARRVKKISKQIQQNQEKFASVLIDFLAGIQTVKVFAMEDFSLKKYREQNHRMADLEKKSARYDLSSRPIVHTIGMMFLATALLYGLYVIQMNVSEVLFYAGLLYVFYEPIKKFAEENSHIQRGVAAVERMHEVMDLKPQIEDRPGAEHLQDFTTKIEFDNVSFGYGERMVLKNLSFCVHKGETVAIVGPTGAGKSTIVNLLPRLYEVQKGEIRIDGKPIQSYTQKSLREKIAFIPQKTFLFLDTITANITFGRHFSREEVCAATASAHADEFISRMPDKYDSILLEGGKNLSGGQQQRLAIARALLKGAPILVMDEATSSLDALSEAHIKSAIKQLKGKITQVIIAHRLSTVEDADRIIYIEQGEKVAEGTREHLLATCPGFKRMWDTMNSSNLSNHGSQNFSIPYIRGSSMESSDIVHN